MRYLPVFLLIFACAESRVPAMTDTPDATVVDVQPDTVGGEIFRRLSQLSDRRGEAETAACELCSGCSVTWPALSDEELRCITDAAGDDLGELFWDLEEALAAAESRIACMEERGCERRSSCFVEREQAAVTGRVTRSCLR